jgi:hypothetical protein
LLIKSCEGRGGEEPNRAPRVRFRWTAEIFSAILWAQALDALGTSRLAAGRGWSFDLKSCEGRGGEEPNRAPRVRFRWTAEIFSAILWAQALDALGTSRLAAGRGWSSILKVARGEVARSLIAHHVSASDGRLRSSTIPLWAMIGAHGWNEEWSLDLTQSCDGRGGEGPNRDKRYPLR